MFFPEQWNFIILHVVLKVDMRISRLLFGSIIFLLFAGGCKKDDGRFSVSGTLTHAGGETLYLEELRVTTARIIDSVRIDRDGRFRLTGMTRIPAFYLLKLNDNKFITLLVDSAEQVEVVADAANFERNYRVEGSEGSGQVKILTDHLTKTRKSLDSLKSLHNIYKGNPGYPMMKERWDRARDSIRQEQVSFSKRFVMEHPFSMASVLALYQKIDDHEYIINDLQTMRVAASALHTIYPESGHVKALYQNTLQWLEEERNARLRQLIREKGENIPEIVLPDPDGNDISLSSIRGKVILLQFWSAENRDSRILNHALVEAYKKFKNRGFEIYQVSVDKNRSEWVDAIDQDGLTWINVGDMKGSITAVRNYNIQTIPYNYLLNREGEIIAQNLKGPGLDNTLSQLLSERN